MKTVVIFGGSGFVGRHIIRRIVKNAYKIIIPYQLPTTEAKLRHFGSIGQVIPIKYSNIQDKTIIEIVKDADVIINLKTMWEENRFSFKTGIYQFNIDLINLINKFNKKKSFLFFSGLGTDKNSTSKRTRIIAKTEEFIRNNCLNSSIFRPGIILGSDDQFLKKLLPLLRYSYFIPLFGTGNAKFQPVYIDDVAKAIEIVIQKELKGSNIFELVGSEIFSYKSFYLFLSDSLKIKRYFIRIPFFMVKILVSILLKIKINLLNLEQLYLFQSDNLSTNTKKKFSDLGIKPQDLRQIIKKNIQ